MTRRLLFQTLLLLLLLMRPMCYAAQPVFTGFWGTEFAIKSPAAVELHERAWVEFFKGDLPKAIAAADEALTKLGSGSDSISDKANILATKAESLVYLAPQKAGEILKLMRDVLADAPTGAEPAQIRLLRDEALVLLFDQNFQLARKKLEQAAETSVANGLTNRPVYAIVLNMQAGVHMAEGRFSDALRYVEASSMILQRSASPNWFLEHVNANVLTGIWMGLGDFATAARYSDRSLELLRRFASEKSSFYAANLLLKASVLERQGKSELAIPVVRQALDTLQESLGKTNVLVATAFITHGTQLVRKGQTAEAIAAFSQALEIYAQLFGPKGSFVATATGLTHQIEGAAVSRRRR